MKNIQSHQEEYHQEENQLEMTSDVCEVDFEQEKEFETHMSRQKDQKNRKFNYDMNEKKAKKKLLKGANRVDHLDVEIKPTCVNMRFSDGSFKEVVLPLIKVWHKKVGESIKFQENEVKIIESITGTDLKVRHMDTKLVILVNNNRIVIHVYNGTQNLMVQGKNFEEFAINHLQPYFTEVIEKDIEKIENFNSNVKEMFGKRMKVKQKSQNKKFPCPQCRVKSSTVADLRMHMKSSHSQLSITNSSKNNKKSKRSCKILIEDDSLLDDSEEDSIIIPLEEKTEMQPEKPDFDCDWLSCDFKSSNRDVLIRHRENEHIPYLREKYLNKPDFTPESRSSSSIDQKVNCEYCSLETETKAQLETHIEKKHIQIQEERSNSQQNAEIEEVDPSPESIVICGTCGKSFEDEKRYMDHLYLHDTVKIVECKDCDKVFGEPIDLEWHMKTEHEVNIFSTESSPIKTFVGECCPFCKLQFQSLEKLKTHIKNVHISEDAKVIYEDEILVERSETCFKCTECDFIGNNNELKTHKHSKHDKEVPFPCEKCGLVLANFALLKEHMEQVHSSVQYSCNFCNFTDNDKKEIEYHLSNDHEEFVILHKMAYQVNELSEKSNHVEAFCTDMTNLLQNILDNQNEIKQELFLIRNSQSAKHTQNTAEKVEATQQRYSSTASSARGTPPPSSTGRSSSPLPVRPQEVSKPKTLYIGDSISSNVNIDALEKATKTQFITAKAYSSTYDTVTNVAKHAARFPKANFTAVIPDKLQNEEFENLIIQAGSVDITNLKTNVEPSKNSEYFKQVAVMSANNLFSACERAVGENPNLKKVVLMKQPPRYDPVTVDPCSIKPVLSELFNSTLVQCWMSSKLKDRIFLGSHNIDCTGGIREARYRETQTGRFDGLHLLGSSGKKAYTNSVLNILNLAEMVDPDFNHSHCPQTRYQTWKKSFNWENDVDIRGSTNVRGAHAQQNKRYEIPTQNRFTGLADNYQGNY